MQEIKKKNGDEKSRVYGDTFSIFSSDFLSNLIFVWLEGDGNWECGLGRPGFGKLQFESMNDGGGMTRIWRIAV